VHFLSVGGESPRGVGGAGAHGVRAEGCSPARPRRGRKRSGQQRESEYLAHQATSSATPLNAIGGYAQLLEDEIRGPITPEQRADLGRIRRSQRHLLNVIENVLGFLKLDSGRIAVRSPGCPVDEIVMASGGAHAADDGSKSTCTSSATPAERLVVRADPPKLQQIIVNLLSNATKFTEPAAT